MTAGTVLLLYLSRCYRYLLPKSYMATYYFNGIILSISELVPVMLTLLIYRHALSKNHVLATNRRFVIPTQKIIAASTKKLLYPFAYGVTAAGISFNVMVELELPKLKKKNELCYYFYYSLDAVMLYIYIG